MSVSALCQALRRQVEGRFASVQVQGEVSGLSQPASGHIYFSLKDADATLGCAFFRAAARRSPIRLRPGLEVIVYGRVSIYPARGQLQIIVERVEAAGEGALRAAFEALRDRLAAEGLFDEARRKPLPSFPRRVGVVSSRSGAAIHDFLQVLGRRAPGVSVLLAPALVQGEQAANQIAKQLGRLDRLGLDLIVLTRGGGSLEDLWAFNEEPLLRAIAAAKTPIVSAVGHEVDVSLSDLVADLRAPTPSAAAELIAPDYAALSSRLEQQGLYLRSLWRRLAEVRARQLERYGAQLQDPRLALSRRRQALDDQQRALERALRQALRIKLEGHRQRGDRLREQHPSRRLRESARQLAAFESRLRGQGQALVAARRPQLRGVQAALRALSPLAVLDRGFALVQDLDGRVISEASALTLGVRHQLRFARGRAIVTPLEIIEEAED